MAELEATQASVEAVATEPAPEPAESEVVAEEADGAQEAPAAVSDHKRKYEELEAEGEVPSELGDAEAATSPASAPSPAPVTAPAPAPAPEVTAAAVASEAEAANGHGGVPDFAEEAEEVTTRIEDESTAGDAKRQRVDGETEAEDEGQQVVETEPMGNGQIPATENLQPVSADKFQESVASVPQQSSPFGEQAVVDGHIARRMEVPNKKVGVLIGRGGETIRFLQFNSGAKIQITRDTEADPNSSTRTVELIGNVESVYKAEQLIKDVIAEADAGGSPSLVARGFGIAQPGAEQLQIQVPNEKIGLIIGKGGETIKNLQTRSGARIQLIPQHLPEGGTSKERTVRITGNMKQIEAATEMIKEVMSQVPMRPSSGGYTQQMHRPRGPAPPQWGPRTMTPRQQTPGHVYQQSGTYPSQAYHGYPLQAPTRGNFGWDQRAGAPVQTPSQMGGYDYYGQGGHPSDIQASAPGPAAAGAPAPPVNYYGQPQAPGYEQSAPYPQSAPAQQTYGHGYDEPKYDNQAPTQQVYGQQQQSSQPGAYSHMGTTPQSGYAQQPYNKQPYGVPSQGLSPQSYGAPRPGQPGEATNQGPPASHGLAGPTQQSYPYGSSAPQQVPGYNQPYGMPVPSSADGYAQQTASYPQQGGQAAPTYTQSTQQGPYPQGAHSGVYGQYPSSQTGYNEQPVAGNASYGYQGGPTVDAGYSANVAASGYGVPPSASGQTGYAQPTSNPSGYEQPMVAQPGYGGAPGNASVGYTQSATSQPGNGQYDTNMMYAHH